MNTERNGPPDTAPDTTAGSSGTLFARIQKGLARSSHALTSGLSGLFSGTKPDAEDIEALEDLLIEADFGVAMAARIAARIGDMRVGRNANHAALKEILASEITTILEPVAQPLKIAPSPHPAVILMVGANGSGKTTTIGKLAGLFGKSDAQTALVAGDTFRAAACEQLEVWAQRSGAALFSRLRADPAGLVFDALQQAVSQNTGIVLIDTAGRLHNRHELMEELRKIVRAIKKSTSRAPDHVLLTIDATTGQNAPAEAKAFREAAGVTGLIVTKLDGSARGGTLVAIADELALPVHFIGIGEGGDDLMPFNARDFAHALVDGRAAHGKPGAG